MTSCVCLSKFNAVRTAHSKQYTFIYQVIAISVLSLTVLISACNKDEFITDGSAKLAFSLDTVSFDTVFTQRGSATLYLKLYNRHNRFIKVSRIWLEGAPQSAFRMNVDGIAGSDISDVEIPPEDSIYVFLEVTVDPDQPISISPFIIEDQVNFMTNGNAQSVVLEAWGQNANYIPGRFFGVGVVR